MPKVVLNNQQCTQWIDGSFISTKIDPRDIDLVNLIDFRLVDRYEKEMMAFIKRAGKENYGIDGYIIKIYPSGHEKFARTKSDLIYWQNWFSISRRNRRKQRFPKGFVEINF